MRHNLWDDAQCLRERTPSAVFFGNDDESVSERNIRIEMAKAVCSRCPVVAACLQWARDHDERGIWGGTTENERWRVESATSTVPVVQEDKPKRSIWMNIAEVDGVTLRMTKRFGDPTWQVLVDEAVRSEHYVEGEGWIAWNRAIEGRMRCD